jgi:hypothetical protein
VSLYEVPERLVSRLKANGLVPAGEPVRIVSWRSPSARVRWEAVNASTHRSFKVGGTVSFRDMFQAEWDVTEEEDGWVIVSPR